MGLAPLGRGAIRSPAGVVMRSYATIIAVMIASMGPARSAMGDTASLDAGAKAKATALLEQGNHLLGEGSYPEALEKFRAAYATYKSPKLLLNIGTTLRQLGRNVDAANVYEEYLRSPDVPAQRAADVRRVLSEIDMVVGWLLVEVSPADAIVRIDGETVSLTRGVAKVRAAPGDHAVTVERAGMSSAIQTVKVSAHSESSLSIQLTPPDKRPVIVLEKTLNPQRIAGWTITIASLASLAAGAVTGGLALAKSAEVKAHCYKDTNQCDAKGVELAATANLFATTSTVTLIAGGVGLGVGLTVLLTAPSAKKSAQALNLHDGFGAGRGGFTIGGALGPSGVWANVAGVF